MSQESQKPQECGFCKSYWDLIRRDEDELDRLKRHPKVYKDAIRSLETSLASRYRIVTKCRNRNHPDSMY